MEPARLEFTDPSGQSQVVEVVETPFRIGRSHNNHLVLPGTEVSRTHAEILWDGERFQLRDCQSRAGTFLNKDKIEQSILTTGDRIGVGSSLELHFKTGGRERSDDTSEVSSSSTAISDLRQTAALLAGLRAFGDTHVLDQVLELVLDTAIEISNAERGFIMLVSSDGKLEFRSGRDRRGETMPGSRFQTSRKIPDEVFKTGKTRIVKDLRDAGTASDHERRIGVLYLDSRQRQSFRSSAMQSALETLANEAAVAIENARLYREARERAKLEQDLYTAQEFQQALLPTLIGGDFFEYVHLKDDVLGFTLGDVAGKGAPAGLLGARIQEIFSAHAPTLIAPHSTIAASNSTLLKRSLESRFVTMVYGILYPDGRLRYCNAGHNHPVLVTAHTPRSQRKRSP
jgi:pSer/pThr/pTyr-binding forkhead associated (FHA) protein